MGDKENRFQGGPVAVQCRDGGIQLGRPFPAAIATTARDTASTAFTTALVTTASCTSCGTA